MLKQYSSENNESRINDVTAENILALLSSCNTICKGPN